MWRKEYLNGGMLWYTIQPRGNVEMGSDDEEEDFSIFDINQLGSIFIF